LGEVVVDGGEVELAELDESAVEEQDDPTRAADRIRTHPIRTAPQVFDRFTKRVMTRE
jgi:hypothetical protein